MSQFHVAHTLSHPNSRSFVSGSASFLRYESRDIFTKGGGSFPMTSNWAGVLYYFLLVLVFLALFETTLVADGLQPRWRPDLRDLRGVLVAFLRS